ncbi:MAG TPA: hypothetical protein VI522_05585, partial [Gammaproteobacteria bacterium]|nr:hypothetical protein [Gammaproteobacteria bacterium]
NHRSFELSAADFVEILRKSDSHFDHESFSLLLTKVSPLTPEQFSLAFIHLCQDNKIEKLELFLAHYPEMKLTEQEQLAVLKVASRKNNKELYDKLLSQYPDVNLSSLLVDSHSRAFVLQQIKAENKNVGQVLSAMNQVSDKAQCTQIFKQQIQHLTLEELIELSKIMRAIQQQNISTEYMPDAANVCIKNLVALREETFGFTYHQDTDVWLELVDALKWQMSMHIQALMVAPLALADNPTPPINERFTSCLHFFQLQSSRETATSHSYGEATKFLQEKLDSPVAQFK